MFDIFVPTLKLSFEVDKADYGNPYWIHLKRESPATVIPVRSDQYEKVGFAGKGDKIDVTIKKGFDGESNPGFFTYALRTEKVIYNPETQVYQVKTSSPIAEIPMNTDDYNRLGRPEYDDSLKLIVKKSGHLEHLKRSGIGLARNISRALQGL